MDRLYEKPRLFIGSASESVKVANEIQRGLTNCTLPEVWTQTEFKLSTSTLSSLLRASVGYDFGVFVLSADDESLIRDRLVHTTRGNVIFELGLFLGALGPDRTFFVLPTGKARPETLSDILGITATTYDPQHFATNPAAALGSACTAIESAVQRAGLSTTRHFRASNPDGTKLLAFSDRIAGSGMEADRLIPRADTELFFAAQNHYHVLVRESKSFKQAIFSFLREEAGRRVRFLICDPDDPHGPDAWSSLFLRDNDYTKHLAKAVQELISWVTEANRAGLRLEAKAVPLVPMSMNFVDPGSEEGLAVFTPNVFEHKSKSRPSFLLSKREHEAAYYAYWAAYEQAFEGGRYLVPPAAP